jgi:protein-tyrosine phosphatase
MAEAIARSLLGDSALVESAGLDAVDGGGAHKNAVSVMEEMGSDIEHHRTRNIRNVDVNSFDLVVAMSPSIARRLRECGVEGGRIAELDVPDPYNSDVDAYRSTAEKITSQLKTLFAMSPEKKTK